MKLKCLFENKRLTILTLGMAGLLAGCCTKSAGGSYSSASYSSEGQAYSAPAENAAASQNQVLPLYKEQLNVGTRQVDDGTVSIRKVVKTETVNEPVQLRTESVVIDRQPASTGQVAENDQPFQDQEITIQLHHDEPVIQKQIVPNGQIVAQVRSDVQQQNIQEQVRRDAVHIDKGNAQNVTISDNVKQYENENEPMGGGGEVGGQASATASGPITDVTILTSAPDADSLNGRQVQLSGVTVERIHGQKLVIKDSSGNKCFVRLNQPMDNIKAGAQVNITGTVAAFSPTSTEQSDEQIPQGKVCIQAQTVEPVQ